MAGRAAGNPVARLLKAPSFGVFRRSGVPDRRRTRICVRGSPGLRPGSREPRNSRLSISGGIYGLNAFDLHIQAPLFTAAPEILTTAIPWCRPGAPRSRRPLRRPVPVGWVALGRCRRFDVDVAVLQFIDNDRAQNPGSFGTNVQSLSLAT